jgi:hypothetical protein
MAPNPKNCCRDLFGPAAVLFGEKKKRAPDGARLGNLICENNRGDYFCPVTAPSHSPQHSLEAQSAGHSLFPPKGQMVQQEDSAIMVAKTKKTERTFFIGVAGVWISWFGLFVLMSVVQSLYREKSYRKTPGS